MTGSLEFKVVDVERLDALDPHSCIRMFRIEGKPTIFKSDVAIIGGGTGGVAAALAACRLGRRVVLVEETSWLGGQMTSQGVSALDENSLVETTGATASYLKLRDEIRNHYRKLGAVDGGARFSPFLDPGDCWVSRLAFEPKVAVKVISGLLEPFLRQGLLTILLRTKAVKARAKNGHVRAVQVVELDSGRFFEVRGRVFIDATELGDLLALANIPYVYGAESRLDTGERHAPEKPHPENVQDFTYPFVVEFSQGQNNLQPAGSHFERFLAEGKFSFLGYKMFADSEKISAEGKSSRLLPFWEYRRLICARQFPGDIFPADLAMINWESNDLRGENIIDVSPELMAERLALAKSLSLGFLRWMQTDAPRDDGGRGYPELKLRLDVLGTRDGLSMYPYIRESRRLKVKSPIVEEEIVRGTACGARADACSDSLGIGHYPVDIHGEQDVPGAAQATLPFQIPARAFISVAGGNVLPAAKNIGTTHVTNGAYRLHPVEWAAGEAAGTIAVVCLTRHRNPAVALETTSSLREIQTILAQAGAPLFWFDDVPVSHPAFAAVQYLAVCGLLPFNSLSLSFEPEKELRALELVFSLSRLMGVANCESVGPSSLDSNFDYAASRSSLTGLGIAVDPDPESIVVSKDLREIAASKPVFVRAPLPEGDRVCRKDFAVWLFEVATSARFFGRR